jgi:hypothetical protein
VIGGVKGAPVPSAAASSFAFNTGEVLVVAFSQPAQGATTGTLTLGQGRSTTGVSSQSTAVPGSLSYSFQATGTYSLKASVDAGVAIMSFSCSLPDTDLAITGTPANITAAATGASGATVAYTAPTATDEEAPPAVVCDHPSGATFPVGTTTVTCTATDADDTPSAVSTSFTVTVNDTDLAITGTPANITAAATGASGATVAYTAPTATDEEAPPAVVCDHPSGATFPVGTTTVTCTATDADDTPSSVSASFTVTVDDTDLALDAAPPNITVAAPAGASGAAVTYTAPTATDEEAPPAVVCDHPSGATFPLGTTTVTCTATDPDDSPSSVSASFSVTVNDPPPTATGLLDQLEAAVKSGWPGKSLSGKIERAKTDLAAGRDRAACRDLHSFVDALTRAHGKSMNKARAAGLIATARQIEVFLGCGKPGHPRHDHKPAPGQPAPPSDPSEQGTGQETRHGSD